MAPNLQHELATLYTVTHSIAEPNLPEEVQICNVKYRELNVALQAPEKLRAELVPHGSYPIMWDSGASISISFDQNDILDTPHNLDSDEE